MAVERIWHTQDCQGQILALAFRPDSGVGFLNFEMVPSQVGEVVTGLKGRPSSVAVELHFPLPYP